MLAYSEETTTTKLQNSRSRSGFKGLPGEQVRGSFEQGRLRKVRQGPLDGVNKAHIGQSIQGCAFGLCTGSDALSRHHGKWKHCIYKRILKFDIASPKVF